MDRFALKNPITKIVIVVFLCSSILFLSAFTCQKETKYLTRLELAVVLEKILDDTSIELKIKNGKSFSDLSKGQYKSIENIIKSEIMDGFSDGTFRPDKPMYNIEVVSYLQKLTGFLRKYKPNSFQAKQLFRILSYNEEATIAFEYSPQNFPKGLEQPNGLTPKSFAVEITNKLIPNQNESERFVFSGKIIDSVSNKPIVNAYISANSNAMAVDKDGRFMFNLDKNTKTADLFAAADGYQPLEIRKDLNLSRNITIRLKPINN